jgi:L-rhamnose isomerase
VTRGVRWDSDHVVRLDDETREIAKELVASGRMQDVALAMDYFDASINRVAAWVIGTRNMCKALLYALLEPTEMLKAKELEGDYTTRLALLEELKSYPFAAVWDYYCEMMGVPVREAWLAEVKQYENDVLSKRN